MWINFCSRGLLSAYHVLGMEVKAKNVVDRAPGCVWPAVPAGMDERVSKYTKESVCDKHHEGSRQGAAMATDTVAGALNKAVEESLTEKRAFKSRPRGQDPSHMKSQEENILRREKETRIRKELPLFQK